MRNILVVFVVGLATGYLGEKLLVASEMSPRSDDLYLEGQSSGGFPSDDEDDNDNISGSGSSELHPIEILEKENVTKEETWRSSWTTLEGTNSSTTSTQDASPTTYIFPEEMEVTELGATDDDTLAETLLPGATDSLFPTTSSPEDTWETDTGNREALPEDAVVLREAGPGGRIQGATQEEITAEGMWHRTDVLAAVIACGVVGFLCAVFLVLFLAYRMKKKDEGSYALGVATAHPGAYHKQELDSHKEFYA